MDEQTIVRDRLGVHKGFGVIVVVPENIKTNIGGYFVCVDWDDGVVNELNSVGWLEEVKNDIRWS